METKYWVSKRLKLVVTRIDDFCTAVYIKNGLPYENLGRLIFQNGGIEEFWNKCLSQEKFNEYKEIERHERKIQYEYRKTRPTIEEIEASKKQKYFDLLSKYEVIPTTEENIQIILSYLNTINWGSWELPKLTINYYAHQYDCDGKIASTITLDKPIQLEDGDMVNKFQVGAPRGHLTKYRRILIL